MDLTVQSLFEAYASGAIGRREFMGRAASLGIAGAAAAALGALVPGGSAEAAAQNVAAARTKIPLDVAEWSYMWVNVHRADTARGSFVGGQQMYVEYMIPAQVRHALPIVLVHGGGGQGTDWMGTPDGRPGWFQYLVSEGYKVFVVDRPGHGRAPLHPDLHGAFPPTAAVLENIAGRFTPPSANPSATPTPYQRQHTQWPGPGNVGSSDLDQLVAGQGGSYVQLAAPAAAAAGAAGGRGGGRQGGAPAGPPPAANQAPANQANAQAIQHAAWRQAGADLLDRIGPAIIMTHSAGGPFGLLVAEARPNLVKATVIIEGAGSGFGGGNRWGMSTIPVTYDPPLTDPSEIKVRWVDTPEQGIAGYYLQEEPARKLPNLKNTKVLFVTAAASFASPGNPGGVAFLKQAGVQAEELRLVTAGITGNGHMMMVEKNSRQVLQPIIDWINKNVAGTNTQAPQKRAPGDSLAMKLADTGIFWVGTERKQMPYGTIHVGQMFVQYLEPAQQRYPLPILLVHGGGGQMVHYMGLGGGSGWAHHFVQAGYNVYMVDRPGHGRSPYHPDALGDVGALVTYDALTRDTKTSAVAPNKQWPGTTGDIGDPLVDQLVTAANSAPRNAQLAQDLWRRHGAELIDRIGPCVVMTHSAGGPFGWIVANERPALVKAVVSFEGATAPLVGQGGQPGTVLPNLKNMPVMYLLSERGGRQGGPILDALTQSGARAEVIALKDRSILGNSHFAMFENNRKQVFDVIRGWIEQKVPAATQTA
jgi:pimeloyl-ACP methyl ester carboxylesterase